MRTLLTGLVFAALTAPAVAAPGLPDKPPRWEYAELTYRSAVSRGCREADDPPPPPTVTVRWVTGSGEVAVKGWAELADKLKAKEFKKDGSPGLQKIQILNHLGAEGWELMESQGSAATAPPRGPDARGFGTLGNSGTRLFKRRLP